MYEQFMGDITYRYSEPRHVQLVLSFVTFRATSLLHLLYFPLNSGIIQDYLPYPKHMLRAKYISISLATVIRCECSLNKFYTSLFVSLYVHREPRQIFMGVDTEHKANLVKDRVNVPITLPHICWVCQYKFNITRLGGVYWTLKTFTGNSLE